MKEIEKEDKISILKKLLEQSRMKVLDFEIAEKTIMSITNFKPTNEQLVAMNNYQTNRNNFLIRCNIIEEMIEDLKNPESSDRADNPDQDSPKKGKKK